MKKVLIFLIIILFFFSGCAEDKQNFVVSRVIDGDTLELENGETIRLLGIDAPEVDEEEYIDAKERLEFLVNNQEIQLESDLEDKDKYGRLLRYVFKDGVNINVRLVKEGYACTYILSDLKYKEELLNAEKHAKNLNISVCRFK